MYAYIKTNYLCLSPPPPPAGGLPGAAAASHRRAAGEGKQSADGRAVLPAA